MLDFHTTTKLLATTYHAVKGDAEGYDYRTATPDQQAAYDRKVAVEGMHYGFTGSRLSFAAEEIIKSCETEGAMIELADLLLGRIAGKPVAIGTIAGELNILARERFEAASKPARA